MRPAPPAAASRARGVPPALVTHVASPLIAALLLHTTALFTPPPSSAVLPSPSASASVTAAPLARSALPSSSLLLGSSDGSGEYASAVDDGLRSFQSSLRRAEDRYSWKKVGEGIGEFADALTTARRAASSSVEETSAAATALMSDPRTQQLLKTTQEGVRTTGKALVDAATLAKEAYQSDETQSALQTTRARVGLVLEAAKHDEDVGLVVGDIAAQVTAELGGAAASQLDQEQTIFSVSP